MEKQGHRSKKFIDGWIEKTIQLRAIGNGRLWQATCFTFQPMRWDPMQQPESGQKRCFDGQSLFYKIHLPVFPKWQIINQS